MSAPKSPADIDGQLIVDLISILLKTEKPDPESLNAAEEAMKAEVFKWFETVTAGHAIVTTDQLQTWLEKIKAHTAMKAELETDIGYVAIALHNLTGIKNPMPTLMKLISGTLKPEALGLDMTRIQAIAEKYAPATCAELKKREEEKKKK